MATKNASKTGNASAACEASDPAVLDRIYAEQPDLQNTEEAAFDEKDLTRLIGALYVICGAGKRAKTTFARFFLSLAAANGRRLRAIDFEGVNPGLSAAIDAEKLGDGVDDGAQLAEVVFPIVEQIAASRQSALIDFEGSDDRPVDMARRLDWLGLMKSYGVPLVIVGVVGGGSDDLVVLDALGRALGGAPHALIIVVNEGLLPHQFRNREVYEKHIGQHAGLKAMGGRDVRFVWMPNCSLIRRLDATKVSYAALLKGYHVPDLPIGLWEASIIHGFLKEFAKTCKDIVPCG